MFLKHYFDDFHVALKKCIFNTISIKVKMLGLYLYTLSIGQKSCNMLSILLNKITLQKEMQNFVTNNVLLEQKVKTQQQQNKQKQI